MCVSTKPPGARPVDLLEADRAAMGALPPVLPDVGWHHQLRLPGDHWVRYQANDYSVHPKAVGRQVHVAAGLDQVVVTCGDEEAARHDKVFASHVTVTDPAHDQARRALRGRRPVDFDGVEPGDEVPARDLSDYDRALGVVA